jgi:hypothetical protein
MSRLRIAGNDDIMSFGKYKGQRLGDIPDGYIRWLWEDTDVKNYVGEDTEKGSIARYIESVYNSIK